LSFSCSDQDGGREIPKDEAKRSIGSDLFPIVLRFHLCLNELGICQNLTVFTPKQLADSWLFFHSFGKPYVA
jgi:hypothetical protein